MNANRKYSLALICLTLVASMSSARAEQNDQACMTRFAVPVSQPFFARDTEIKANHSGTGFATFFGSSMGAVLGGFAGALYATATRGCGPTGEKACYGKGLAVMGAGAGIGALPGLFMYNEESKAAKLEKKNHKRRWQDYDVAAGAQQLVQSSYRLLDDSQDLTAARELEAFDIAEIKGADRIPATELAQSITTLVAQGRACVGDRTWKREDFARYLKNNRQPASTAQTLTSQSPAR